MKNNKCLPTAITKDKICESSPIELNIVAFGQWNLGKPSGKDRTELAPPLPLTNPLLVARDLLVPSDVSSVDGTGLINYKLGACDR